MNDPTNRIETGQRLPNFTLPDLRKKPVSLSSYRRRSNLIVLFSGDPVPFAFTRLLDELAEGYDGLDEHEAEALAVLTVSHAEANSQRDWTKDPFPVLIDPGGDVHREAGALDEMGHPAFTIAILDRYGVIYASYEVNQDTPPPSVQEMLEWLAYIELQCDE
jgi:mycoredoxin-dependent peroxiredoxin